MSKEPEYQGLCFRCEWRARYLETDSGPRCECKERDKQVASCYMFRPCIPIILQRNAGDRRPIGGPIFLSARFHGVKLVKDAPTVAHYVRRRGCRSFVLLRTMPDRKTARKAKQ